MGFFEGFADELLKVAQAAKAYKDPKTGQWKFKPVAMPKMKTPGAVPAPQPKFQPGSGYKPATGDAFETGKRALKKTQQFKGMGSFTKQRRALGRENVYGM